MAITHKIASESWKLFTQAFRAAKNKSYTVNNALVPVSQFRLYSELSKDLNLNIDTSCVKKLNEIVSNGKFLRVIVEGGGCSGFQYKFELDETVDDEDDMVFTKDGAKVVSDKESVKILNGATVEYHEDLIRAGFRVSNIPQAEKGCSCGISFSVKL